MAEVRTYLQTCLSAHVPLYVTPYRRNSPEPFEPINFALIAQEATYVNNLALHMRQSSYHLTSLKQCPLRLHYQP